MFVMASLQMNSYKQFVFKVLAAFICNIVLGFYAIWYFIGKMPVKSSTPDDINFSGSYCFLFLTVITLASLVYSVREKGIIDKVTTDRPLDLRILTFIIITLHIPLLLIYGILLLLFGLNSLT